MEVMKKRRWVAGLMALVMVFVTVVSVFTPGMTARAAGTTLIVHYGGRADNSYDDGKVSGSTLPMRTILAKWLCTRRTVSREASVSSCG